MSSLPPSITVLVRDWLSANNVLLRGRDGNVIIDTGYVRDAPRTLALVAEALAGEPLVLIVNTHGHSDHIGGNAALAARYACPIAVPAGEAALLENWDTRGDRFAVSSTLAPGSRHVWGELEWQALFAPGHDMGALVFYNSEQRILLSGDALWEHGFGLVMPPEIDPACMPATRATLDAIAALDIRCVIPGHGQPFTDAGAALERAYSRLAALQADSRRAARSVVKALLAFALLDRRRMALATLPDYVERIGFFRDFNALFFRQRPADFATMLVEDLERAGAVRREGEWLLAIS